MIRLWLYSALALALQLSCIQRRRELGDVSPGNVTIELKGIKLGLDSKWQVALQGCQSNPLFGMILEGNLARFANVPPMTSGTTCTVELSDPPSAPVTAGTKWLEREGLRFRDTKVVISQFPDGTRRGQAQHLERLFDVVTNGVATFVDVAVPLHRSLDFKVNTIMETSLNCEPLSPYFGLIEEKQFGIAGDVQRALVTFHFPLSKEGSTTYRCSSMTVFSNRMVVAFAAPRQPAEIRVGSEPAVLQTETVFELVAVDSTSSDVEVKPRL